MYIELSFKKNSCIIWSGIFWCILKCLINIFALLLKNEPLANLFMYKHGWTSMVNGSALNIASFMSCDSSKGPHLPIHTTVVRSKLSHSARDTLGRWLRGWRYDPLILQSERPTVRPEQHLPQRRQNVQNYCIDMAVLFIILTKQVRILILK